MDGTPTLRSGERLDRFEIMAVLPGGNMGEVYRARDTELQRDVAIKLLPRAEGHDLDRFVREARIAAGFAHPNIMNIFDVRTHQRGDQTFPYLVMEFIEGETLRERMQRAASEDQVIRWLSEVAAGLAELHSHGVVHRDLKPANIMIGKDNRARIIDFGLAKTAGSTVTTIGAMVGTVDYFSPEQANQETVGYRTDIFSFGIVLYEALTGRHPFHRSTNLHTMHAIHAESPGRIPGRVGEIVARCLEKVPTDRYDDAADIARHLRELQPTPNPNIKTTTPAATVDPDAKTLEITTDRIAPPVRYWRLIALIATLLLAVIFAAYKQKALPDPEHPPRAQTSSPSATSKTAALPSCGLTASPGTIIFGASAQLRWSSSNAADAVISPAIGIVGPNGSMDVSPRVTTTYYFVVTNADGVVAESSVTLLVTGAPADLKITPATGSITASPATISRKGEVAELRWNSSDATHVVITPSIGIVPLQGRIQVAPPVTTKYTMTISNDTGDSAPRTSATVYVDPAAAPTGMVASPRLAVDCVAATQPGSGGTVVESSSACSVPAGRTVTQAVLHYTLDDGGEISIDGRPVFMKAPSSGPREGTVSLPVGLFAPGKSFLVGVTARNAMSPDGAPVGEVFGRAAVHLVARDAAAAVELGVTPGVIKRGENAYLDWSSIDATTLALNPLVGIVAPRGRIAVSPTQTTTYTLQGWSASGDPAKGSVKLEVQPAPQTAMPAAQISVSPGTIAHGQSAHLEWASINATRIEITPDIGLVAPSGKIDVTPQATTTYIISVWTPAGELARTSATLAVSPAATGVAGSILASPDTIHPGESTSLRWNSFNATRVVITPDVGPVALQGRIAVSPRATTTYTITIENASSRTDGTATVHVLGSRRQRR